MMTRVSQLWDLIETWGFRVDIKNIVANVDNNANDANGANNADYNDDKDGNVDKGISALGLDRDMGFSRGHQGCQGHRLHDDDNDEEEDDDVDDNDKDDDNNNDKGISALGLDRALGFREDIKDIKGISLMMITMMMRTTMR